MQGNGLTQYSLFEQIIWSRQKNIYVECSVFVVVVVLVDILALCCMVDFHPAPGSLTQSTSRIACLCGCNYAPSCSEQL